MRLNPATLLQYCIHSQLLLLPPPIQTVIIRWGIRGMLCFFAKTTCVRASSIIPVSQMCFASKLMGLFWFAELLHRVILLSGSGLSPWALQRDPLWVKRSVAKHTGCHGDLHEDDLAPCLRQKHLNELLSVRVEAPRFLPGRLRIICGDALLLMGWGPIDSINFGCEHLNTLPRTFLNKQPE